MTQDTTRSARRKLSDQVYEHLNGLIVSGALKPGDKMPSERELMARCGVGRPAVREAMQALATLGLISISQGERARVTQLTADSVLEQIDGAARHMLSTSPGSLEHLKGARALFETGVVREAAVKAAKQDIERLRKALDYQRSVIGNPSEFVAADMSFHKTLAGVTGNPILVAVSDAMLNWLAEFHIELLRWRGNENVTLEEHALILDCIEKHNPTAAVQAMTEHLSRSRALFRNRQE